MRSSIHVIPPLRSYPLINFPAPTGTEVTEYMEDTQNRRERRREKWEDIFL
jgi:hypothetical protein